MKPATLLALALAAAPAAARAQPSPRHGSFELGAGTYRPDIDSAFAPPGPYQQVFGSGRGWMFRAGVSKALYHAGSARSSSGSGPAGSATRATGWWTPAAP